MNLASPFQLGIFYNSVITDTWTVISSDTEQSRAILLLQLVQFPKAELKDKRCDAFLNSLLYGDSEVGKSIGFISLHRETVGK